MLRRSGTSLLCLSLDPSLKPFVEARLVDVKRQLSRTQSVQVSDIGEVSLSSSLIRFVSGNPHNEVILRGRFCLRVTLMVAVGFPQGPAFASSPLDSSPFGRCLSATSRSHEVWRARFDSDLNSLRFESHSAPQRFGRLEESAIAPTDPDKPWLLPSALATRSFAGSAH